MTIQKMKNKPQLPVAAAVLAVTALMLVCVPGSADKALGFSLTAEQIEVPAPPVIPASKPVDVTWVEDNAIKIDGDLSDWPSDAAPLPTAYTDADDLSATAYLAVSASDFYMACDVTDDFYNMHGYGENMWEYDSVQFAIDPLCKRTVGRYGDYDQEIGFCLFLDEPLVWRWQRPFGMPGEKVPGAQLAVNLSEGKAVYEARIPIQQLWPLRPELGWPCGFSYLVNDRDDSRDREGFGAWASGIGAGKDPSAFGVLNFPSDRIPSSTVVAARFLTPQDPTPSTQPQKWTCDIYAAHAGTVTIECTGSVEHGEAKGSRIWAQASFDVPKGVSRWHLSADLRKFAPHRTKVIPSVTLDGAAAAPCHPFTVYVYEPSR